MIPKKPNVDHFSNGLCIHCNLAQEQIGQLRMVQSEIEGLWEKNILELEGKVDALLQKYPEDRHNDIVEGYGWDFHEFQTLLPNIHRGALVVSIYATLEHELNGLVYILSSSLETDLKLKDVAGSGVNRAFRYMEKVAGYDLTGLGEERSFISNLGRLRNCIAHAGGVLPDSESDKLVRFVQQEQGLDGMAGSGLEIAGDFIDRTTEVTETFFIKLDEETQKFIQREG